jgi:hypothetical protein
MRYVLFLIIIIFVIFSCKKNSAPQNVSILAGDVTVLESVGDTLLPSDTCYSTRLVSFQCSKNFINPQWTIGEYTYSQGVRSVNLIFPEPNHINITLTGHLSQTKDTVIKKQVTIVNATDYISPLVGQYLGYNTDLKNDTFRITIEYWFGNRYTWWSNGAYSISNLPRYYKDTTQNFNGFTRPEIQGIISSTGYRNMSFDKSGNILASGIKGYASLKRGVKDTLVVNYTLLDSVKYHQNNLISYIKKTFVGIRN